jgi:hypothetical protein
MNRHHMVRNKRTPQSGYALLLVIFLATLMLIAALAAAPNILTEGKREKEQDMIWRGKQYVRGVKLYYRKTGRFPTSLEDLTKPKTGVRFMRQAYKDPMNKEDGSWRLIYVGPAGQLIGSLNPHQTSLQMPTSGAQTGQPAPSPGNANPQQAGTSPGQPPTGAQSGSGQAGATTSGTGGNAQGTDTSDSSGNPQDVPTGDTPVIVGGNIIGVGSKVNQRSLMVWNKAKNYRLFEFIWDPSKDVMALGQTGTQIGTPNPSGAGPNIPGQPTQPNFGAPMPNPQPPNPNPNPHP